MDMKVLRFSALLVLFSLYACGGGSDISVVKDGHMSFDNSVTVGDVLDNCQSLENREWSEFETEQKQKIVSFRADISTDVKKMDIAYLPNWAKDRLFLATYNPVAQLTLQFQVNKDDSFDLIYAGTTLKPNVVVEELLDAKRYQKLTQKGRSREISSTIRRLYANQGMSCDEIISPVYQEYYRQRMVQTYAEAKAATQKLETLDYPSKYIDHRLDVYVNVDTKAVLAGNLKAGILWGVSINEERGSTCSFFEEGKLNSDGTQFQFNQSDCSPQIEIKQNKSGTGTQSTILVSNINDCGFCGLGASLDGEYRRIGYAYVYKQRNSDQVKVKLTVEGYL